jgi:hypothetical protein
MCEIPKSELKALRERYAPKDAMWYLVTPTGERSQVVYLDGLRAQYAIMRAKWGMVKLRKVKV